MDMASKADVGNTPLKGKKNEEGSSTGIPNKKHKPNEAVAMGPEVVIDSAPEAEPFSSASDAPAAAVVLSPEIKKMLEAYMKESACINALKADIEALKADMKELEASTKELEAETKELRTLLDGIAGAMEPATEYALFETAIYEFVEANHPQESNKIKYQVSQLCSWILYNLFGEQKPYAPAVPSKDFCSEQEVLSFLLASRNGGD
ncbi:expressed unknown protein [Seminavis robusta]|uniref:Uncharacterized protein n=1 Tax=Seminavis robusta TaxID=568900 RepID=A0A9N8HTE1_9STRA|nr:expressed unknown protein [Seminavis robusta]|eukprot:Sro1570_g283240.1 n/a (206) ;mRNA; r:14936-15553